MHPTEGQDGLTCLTANPEDTHANLVFVHGLGGSAFKTWNAGDDTELGYWPAKLAEDRPYCCVWVLQYTADILDSPLKRHKTIDLIDKGRWLVDQLVQHGVQEKPIVFVCHSLGGLLVKQALLFSQSLGPDSWRSVWAQTQAVFFLATPHTGSQLADIAQTLAGLIRRLTHPLAGLVLKPSLALRNLEKNNPTLRYLRDWYRYYAPVQGIETFAYAEGSALFGTMVVEVEAANPQIAGADFVQLSDENHLSIAKPENSRKTVHRKVAGYLEGLEERVTEGRIESAASFLPSREALQRAAEKRKLISRICGWWWEVIRVDGDIEVSLFEIRPNPMTNSVVCEHGFHYDRQGRPLSKWHSVMADVAMERKDIVLSYYWKGKRLHGDKLGQRFEGFGRIEFDQPFPPTNRVDRGSGRFWDFNASHPEQTREKIVEVLLRERNDKVIRDMNDRPGIRNKKAWIRPMLEYVSLHET
jgi:hypothetical protein